MNSNYSYSRITTYSKCGQMYKLRYIDGIKSGSSSSTIKGNLCHEVLEELHKNGGDPLDIYVSNLKSLLESRALVVPDGCIEKLLFLCQAKDDLYIRASEDYTGRDAIRKRDGSVASHPEMTGVWMKEIKKLNLDSTSFNIDKEFEFLNPELIGISISEVVEDSYRILSRYTIPESIVETLHTELPVSKVTDNGDIINSVLIPSQYVDNDNINLVCFIDWIGITKVDGEDGLTIIDYKTNKANTDASQVRYNAQLCLYSYAVEQILGEPVKRIGIHHLRSNTLHLAEVDKDVVNEVMSNLFSPHIQIKNGIFKKHMPDSSYSPCLNMYGQVCPYIKNCYPDYEAASR